MQKLVLVLGAVALLGMTHLLVNTNTVANLAGCCPTSTGYCCSGNCACGLQENAVSEDSSIFSQWLAWKVEHKKSYTTVEEESHRFSVWKENLRLILENTSTEYELGLNLFSDLSNEEWRALYLMNKGIVKSFHTEETSSENHIPQGFTAPTSVNWVSQGKTISVLNQGQCGSCWAFSTVESIDSAYAVSKNVSPVPNLSEQQVVSCSSSYGEYGCNGGNVVPAYKYVLAHPLANNSQYPYTSGNTKATGTCDKSKESLGTSNPYGKITGYKTIPAGNCAALENAIALTPVSVCVDASTWQNYKSGVFSNCGTSLDHCVLAVGYVENQYWYVQNSWTTGWGMGGFIQLKWGNTCGVCK